MHDVHHPHIIIYMYVFVLQKKNIIIVCLDLIFPYLSGTSLISLIFVPELCMLDADGYLSHLQGCHCKGCHCMEYDHMGYSHYPCYYYQYYYCFGFARYICLYARHPYIPDPYSYSSYTSMSLSYWPSSSPCWAIPTISYVSAPST